MQLPQQISKLFIHRFVGFYYYYSYSLNCFHRQVNQKACQILKSLLLTLSQIQVAQYLTHVSEHDVEKLRLASLKMLMELIPDYCQDSDTLQQVVKK